MLGCTLKVNFCTEESSLSRNRQIERLAFLDNTMEDIVFVWLQLCECICVLVLTLTVEYLGRCGLSPRSYSVSCYITDNYIKKNHFPYLSAFWGVSCRWLEEVSMIPAIHTCTPKHTEAHVFSHHGTHRHIGRFVITWKKKHVYSASWQ